MLIENDRRKRVERRVVSSAPPASHGERRKAMQRRVLDIGVQSFDAWLSKHSAQSGVHFRHELLPSAAANEGMVAALF